MPRQLLPVAVSQSTQIRAAPVAGGRRVKTSTSSYVATARAETPPVRVVAPFVADTHAQRREKALRVLLDARELLRRDGWLRGSTAGVGGWSLTAALMQSGDMVAAEWARWVLRGVLFEADLPAWADHPARERRDIFRALQRAIAVCRVGRRAGGWTVAP